MNSKDFLNKAYEFGFDNFQIFSKTKFAKKIEMADGVILSDTIKNVNSYNYKGEILGKTVKGNSGYLSDDLLTELKEKAELTDTNYDDVYLKGQKNILANFEVPSEDFVLIKNKILGLNKLREKYPLIKNVLVHYYYLNIYEEILDGDIILQKGRCYHQVYLEVTSDDGENQATESVSILMKELDFNNLEKKLLDLMEMATLKLNVDGLDGGKYDVLFMNKTLSMMLDELLLAFSADEVHKDKSILKGKLNQKIFGENFTLIEEPLNKDYPGYTTFDNEGTPTTNKEIVSNGVLKTYLYDNKNALIDNKGNGGNYYGGIDVRNLYIKPGDTSYDEIIKGMKNGLIVTDFMATGSAVNTLTGEISIQIFGFVVNDGKIARAFKPCVLTTSFFELFNNIKVIGSDLMFDSESIGCPSALFEKLNISGS